jgi:hypothetical protein
MLPLENTSSKDNNNEETDMALTVRGTLPGISTIWSDGSVTLHAITADVTVTTADTKHEHRGKRERQRKKKPDLEMRQLWRVFPLSTSSESSVTFEELGFTYEPGIIYGSFEHSNSDKDVNQENTLGSHGAILLGGRYISSTKSSKVSFHALDALSGASLWDLDGTRGWSSPTRDHKKAQTDAPIPIIHTTSSARRRSHLPVADTMDPELDNENSFVEGGDVLTSEECMAHFRHSVLDEASGALPHEFWDGDHGSLSVGRFERVKKSPRKKSRALNKKAQLNQRDALVGRGREGSSPKTVDGSGHGGGTIASSRGKGSGAGTGSWQSDLLQRAIPQRLINQQKYNANHPRMGKPNVVVFHGRDGLAILSLKNGRPVCHVSLVDNALYADIDKNGVVDIIQVVTSSDESQSGHIQELIQRINKSTGGDGSRVDNKNSMSIHDEPVICHALVTSGLPPREEVFTAPLCMGGPLSLSTVNHKMKLRAAPPLIVESSLGYGNDVVFAMNNGVIVRYDYNGREVWRKKSAKDGTPSWNSDSVLLGRVQFGVIKSHSSVSASSHRNQHRPGSPVRPILISGEDGAAVISPSNGRVLSSVTFPEPSLVQPLLADLDGDGTDDLCVVTAKALWGYKIVVETGRSGFFSIVVVTLVVGVALSALFQKTNPTARRSMDA